MGDKIFSILCDVPWNFVEEFRMGHQNFGGNIIFPSGPPWQLLYERSLINEMTALQLYNMLARPRLFIFFVFDE